MNIENKYKYLLPREIHDLIIYKNLGLYCHSCNKKYLVSDFFRKETKPLDISKISSCSWECFYSNHPFKGTSVWSDPFK